MVEFLVKTVDATHPDPIKNRRGCYKRGDVIAVMPQRHLGDVARNPIAAGRAIIMVPNMDERDAGRYLDPQLDRDGNVVSRRLFTLDFDAIPEFARENLDRDGFTELARQELEPFFVPKPEPTPEPTPGVFSRMWAWMTGS